MQAVMSELQQLLSVHVLHIYELLRDFLLIGPLPVIEKQHCFPHNSLNLCTCFCFLQQAAQVIRLFAVLFLSSVTFVRYFTVQDVQPAIENGDSLIEFPEGLLSFLLQRHTAVHAFQI